MDQRTLNELDSARCTSGEHIPLIDGGSFDWLRTLTSNHKFIFVASAMGSQLAAYLYRPLIA
jgi:hypothetical protein